MKYRLDQVAQLRYNAPRLLLRKPPFRIVFHHLPKCGGTSVHQAIRRCFPLDPRIEARIVADASARTARLTGRSLYAVREELLLYHMSLERMAYVSGHVPFSERAFQQFGSRWSFVTLIRHPVARWLSEYFDNWKKSPDVHASIDVSLDEHLESPSGRARGSVCLRFFAGSTQEPSLQRALQMLRRFAVVGLLENLDAFGDSFQVRFGRRLNISHFNRNPVSVNVQKQMVTPEVWRRVEEICAPDLELYDAVRTGDWQGS